MTEEFSPVVDITDPLQNKNYVQKIVHLRNFLNEDLDDFRRNNSGAVTIISRVYKDENRKPVALEYAVAFASPKEQFSRKFGVELATQRLQNKDEVYSSRMRMINSYYNNDIILMSIISDILRNMEYPKHARNLLLEKFISF